MAVTIETTQVKSPSGRRVAKLCAECGGIMSGVPSLMRKRRYCSQPCMGAHRSGPAAYNWSGGTSIARLNLNRSPEYAAWRLSVLVRDGWRCRQCDARGVRTNRHLEVHHIVPVSVAPESALDISNGIALCRSHHTATLGREHEFARHFSLLLGLPLVSQPRPNRPERTPLAVSAEELREMYVAREMSTPKIAAAYGVTPQCVQKYLKRYGIPARSTKEVSRVRFGRAA